MHTDRRDYIKNDTKVFRGVGHEANEMARKHASETRSYIFNVYETKEVVNHRGRKEFVNEHIGYGVPK